MRRGNWRPSCRRSKMRTPLWPKPPLTEATLRLALSNILTCSLKRRISMVSLISVNLLTQNISSFGHNNISSNYQKVVLVLLHKCRAWCQGWCLVRCKAASNNNKWINNSTLWLWVGEWTWIWAAWAECKCQWGCQATKQLSGQFLQTSKTILTAGNESQQILLRICAKII